MAVTNGLEDRDFEITPGVVVRLYSIEHLRSSNPAADCDAGELADQLDSQGSELARQLAARLRRLASPRNDDRALVSAAVWRGHWLGLGATWGVSTWADALWAAAALVLEARGVEHPNELPPAPK